MTTLSELEQYQPTTEQDRWLYLNSRRNLLGWLADVSADLADAHEAAGDLLAARATTELTEHYLDLYSTAEHRVEEYRPVIVRSINTARGAHR